jgi:hypothetical protein
VTYTLAPNASVFLLYDLAAARYRVIAGQSVRTPLLLSTSGATVAAGSTVYIGPGYASAGEIAFRAPYTGVLRNLRPNSENVPGAGETFVYTLRVNGSDTAVTCTTSGAGSSGSTDSTHSVPVVANQVISVKLVTSAGANVCPHWASLEYENLA